MDILIILGLLIHYVADFLLQTHDQAVNKSSSWKYLTDHTVVYSLFWVACLLPIYLELGYTAVGSLLLSIAFGAITFVCHTTTDYFTSRWVKRLFDKKDFHNGFCVIGFDQILHYLQLYYTFKLLSI